MTTRPPWTPPIPTHWGDALNTGFGDHFREPLTEWFTQYVAGDDLTTVGLRAHVAWLRHSERGVDSDRFMDAAFEATDTEITLALDAAIYELAARRPRYLIPGQKPDSTTALDKILEAGGSAWRVRDDSGGLERRVPEAVRTEVAGAITSARVASVAASDHLMNAWRHAYGIAPNATAAYSDAIRAVESAAGRLVEPNNAKATLGTINGAIRAAPGVWRIAITASGAPRDGTPVLAMMELLWTGQTDRHGANPTIPVTIEAAQSAVHLAATLVQWWTSGGVTKV